MNRGEGGGRGRGGEGKRGGRCVLERWPVCVERSTTRDRKVEYTEHNKNKSKLLHHESASVHQYIQVT